MWWRLAIAGTMLASTAWSAPADDVLYASRRGGVIEAFKPETLDAISRIQLPGSVESVAQDPSGKRLFVALPLRDDPHGCCALYALDLPSLHLIFLAEPVLRATTTIDRVLFERSNTGIESFDSRSLAPLPKLVATGLNRMSPSPDGKWLFATANSPRPSLVLFDLSRGVETWRSDLASGGEIEGAWIGEQYFLFAVDRAGNGRLWMVAPDHPEVPSPIAVSLPKDDARPGCGPIVQSMIAVGERLAAYPLFGHKLDKRRDCPQVPGGYVVIDPKTGAASNRLAASAHFRQMVANADGQYLYGLDVGDAGWNHVRILKLDARSGATLQVKNLDNDVWFLAAR